MTATQWTFHSSSPDASLELGRALGRALRGGLVIGLVGPLGAGKTHLVKGIVQGNSDKPREATSPTFTLIHEYPGRLMLYHLDAYRLNRPAEFSALGIEELIRADSAVIVEWADKVQRALPSDRLWVVIEPTGDQTREIHMKSGGEVSRVCLESLRQVH